VRWLASAAPQRKGQARMMPVRNNATIVRTVNVQRQTNPDPKMIGALSLRSSGLGSSS